MDYPLDRRHRGFAPWLPELTLGILQKTARHADGRGLVAACGTLGTGFGIAFFNALAVAPTAWSTFGARDLNPFSDQTASDGLAAYPGSAVPWAALDVPPNVEFSCPTGDLCVFTVSGTSARVAGDSNLTIYVLIRPIDPSAGATFTQFPAATIQGDGTWSASAQAGSSSYPAATGDSIEVSAMIVDTDAGVPPAIPPSVTADEIPGLVAVTGLLPATVRVGPWRRTRDTPIEPGMEAARRSSSMSCSIRRGADERTRSADLLITKRLERALAADPRVGGYPWVPDMEVGREIGAQFAHEPLGERVAERESADVFVEIARIPAAPAH